MGGVLAGCALWQQLDLDAFWLARLLHAKAPVGAGVANPDAYRLIDPGSEWRLHRDWFTANAMTDLLEVDFALAGKDTLYRCLDKLLPHSRH